jgi:hypothetical protein
MRSIINVDRGLVFGPPAAGKSSLVAYLSGLRIPRVHSPTEGYERTRGINFDLNSNNQYYFQLREMIEIGGEFGDLLQGALKNENPKALLFVVDHSNIQLEKKILGQVVTAVRNVVNETGLEGIDLQYLLILVNKCDVWAPDAIHISKILSEYEETIFKDEISQLGKLLPNLETAINASCLVNPSLRIHTDNALRELAYSLAGDANG